ncbi:hypothetical protein LTR05_007634 [Lithohypha guttulata]|uniref:NAD(P)-binding domain-containing protein n=1 Tax=Lithohypha guttulata TaxID=1690604 RepID=A0AAN7Y3Z0_9EURO|nr:hypothetical protein LTR05_007634 [Lithohypha guttulata]
MSSYAILGATGNVGSSLLQLLSKNSTNEIHVFVRSRSKLFNLLPAVKDQSNVIVYEGQIQDVDLIAKCIHNTKAVFQATALSENVPGCSIATDTIKVVVEALRILRSQDDKEKLPKLVVLSSASVTDKFWKGVPRFVHRTIYNANCYIYDDLREAEKYLRDQQDWIAATFMKPGGLVSDVERGHELSLDECHTFMSFLDLAAAMIEVADTGDDRWDMKDVSLVPQTVGARFEYMAPYVLGKGLVACFFPQLYMSLRAWIP